MKRVLALTIAAFLLVTSPAYAKISFAGYTWNTFSGTGRLGQHWSASHVKVQNGVLSELISGNVAGGVGNTGFHTYGTYTARFRMTKGGGKYAILLFGKGPHQEIDFAEDHPVDPNRTEMTATVHWGQSNNMIHLSRPGDYTQWHRAGVIWTHDKLTFTLDGDTWATVTDHVPDYPMHMTVQTSAHGGSPSTLYVSDVRIG